MPHSHKSQESVTVCVGAESQAEKKRGIYIPTGIIPHVY